MPQRQATKRLNTAAVQGEDSYAVVRRIDLGEAKSLFVKSRKKTVDLQVAVAQAVRKYDEGRPDSDRGAMLRAALGAALDAVREQPDDYDEMTEVMKLLATHVTEWNWVDDDGKPLPLPKDHPEVMDQLTDLEVQALSNALRGPDAATGKS